MHAGLPFHPLADIFPLMQGEEYASLVADIKAHGLRDPAIVYEDELLDGRNRQRACLDAGVPLRTRPFEGDDPLAFVISVNLHRRHLNVSQRAMIAAKIANLALGSNQYVSRITHDVSTGREFSPPMKVAAASVGVDVTSVKQARAVHATGAAALVRAVEQGTIAVSVAAKLAALPKEQQREAVKEPERAKHFVKRVTRETHERELAEATIEASRALGTKLYGVIYADPPWQFAPYSRDTGMDRAADNHYPTMSLDDIRAIKVPAADDCVLFLWATAPMLSEALSVMQAWGFAYKSHVVWIKDRMGTGYWFRSMHELLLVGTRGNPPAPAPGEQFTSVIDARASEHSAKPAAFAEMIDEMFPYASGLEMFARAPRLGWDVWGNQVA